MRVLCVEPHGDGLLDIAIRAQALGHAVRYFCRDYEQHRAPIGRGLVERVADFRDSMRWSDLVILGANDYCMTEFDRWRLSGIPIIGGSSQSALWEKDRAHGMDVFKRAGIPILPYREFTDYDAAIAYVKREDKPFASKPSGKCDDKALSYVAKEPRDLLYMLDRWRRAGKRQGLEFILQEKASGVEFAVGAWFGPGGFAPGVELNWEHKKLMAGNLGVNCGEMGTVMAYVASDKIADKVLKPLEPQLDRLGYCGNCDINCIVDDEGTPWPLEFTMRCGWPAFNIETVLFDVDFVEFLAGLAVGDVPRRPHRLNEVAVGVVLAHGDFPHSHITRREIVGVPIWDCDPEDDELHYAQAMVDGAGDMATAGDYVLIATGVGGTVQEARRRAYRAIERPKMPTEPFWRPDIGLRLRRDLDRLQAHGYALDVEY